MTQTITPKRYRSANGQEVEAVKAEGQGTLAALRDSDWTDGHLALMSYPHAPAVAYVGAEPPLALTGTILQLDQVLVKGPGGDFEVLPAASFDARFELVTGGRHL